MSGRDSGLIEYSLLHSGIAFIFIFFNQEAQAEYCGSSGTVTPQVTPSQQCFYHPLMIGAMMSAKIQISKRAHVLIKITRKGGHVVLEATKGGNRIFYLFIYFIFWFLS